MVERLNIVMANNTELSKKITAMREGGKILGNLLKDLKNYVKPGMTGKEIDSWVRKEIIKRGAGVAYDMLDDNFPGAICISVNDELVHGAPKDEVLEEGDKVSFDLDIYYKGYFTDSAFTMIMGEKGSPAVKKMISPSFFWVKPCSLHTIATRFSDSVLILNASSLLT